MALSPSSWRAFGRRYLIALGVTFVLVTGGVVGANQVIDSRLSDIPRVGGLDLPSGPGEAGNYLVIGSDSRDFVDNASEAQAFGTSADTGPPKSDTLMVVHIDPEAKTSLLVSFPRDLLVDVPGRGRAKINSAFNDGPQKVVDTLKENFDIDINHYVEVNFKAFTGIVDAIGKIAVPFPAPARDLYSGLNVPNAGCVALDGEQALAFVRARHMQYLVSGKWTDASPRADLDRITRQQNFIRRLASAAAAKAGSNPLTAYEIANATIPKLKIDTKLDKAGIFRLINTFRKVNPNDDSSVEMLTIPNEPASDGASLVVKEPDAQQVLARLRTFGSTDTSTENLKVLPSQVRVQVLNASGVTGAAGTAIGEFQQYSFAPAGVGNTARLTKTEIHYRPGNEDKAKLVQKYTGGVGQLVADPAIRDADVVVMLAKDFHGVTAPAGAKTTTTTKAPASGKTSGATTKTTAPPGAAC